MRWSVILSSMCIVSATAAVLGIDYGTEYVKSSLVAPNAPFEIVLTPDSQRKDASGLVIKPDDGSRLYGSSGLSLLPKFPENSFYAVKQLLGVPFDDIRVGLFEETHPGLQLVPTERNTVAFNASGVVIPIEEVVAMQINDVKSRATEMVREKTHSKSATLRDVTISVPGHFGSAQRQALIDAVDLVDADLVGLVSDGVAVAVNYANSPAISTKLSNEKHYVVVYDAGAASTTSTLVSLALRTDDESIVDVKVEGFGNSILLSGRSLTTLLRELLYTRFIESYKPIERTPRLLNRLWREAERAKHVLSANTEVFVHIESLADDVDLSTKVTRQEFEELANDQISEVVEPLRTSLAGFEDTDIDAVVLVGGATRTPFVLEELKKKVGETKLSKNVNADEANVQGTCMRGVNLSGLYRSKRIFEVTDITTNAYEAHIRTNKDAPPQHLEIFGAGTPLGSNVEIPLPENVTQIEVYEGRKKLVLWDLPYLKMNVDSLYEPGPLTCIDKAKLLAKFSLSSNGIFKLNSIEAVCDSIKSPTSTSLKNSVTNSVVSESVSASQSTDSTSAELDNTKTGTATMSQSASTGVQRPKTRRVSTQVSWIQAPIGATERKNIRAHLDALNKGDEDRVLYGVLHHELESLAYRLRGLVSEGQEELADLSHRLISWIDDGAGTLDELKENLEEARGVFSKSSESKDTTVTTSASSVTSTESITKSTSTDSHESPSHDEL